MFEDRFKNSYIIFISVLKFLVICHRYKLTVFFIHFYPNIDHLFYNRFQINNMVLFYSEQDYSMIKKIRSPLHHIQQLLFHRDLLLILLFHSYEL